MPAIAGNRTLGDLRNAHSTKASFNKAMRTDARMRYKESGKETVCLVCGEKRQIDYCHKKPIEDFPLEATIVEINGPGNIVVLCPLHHRILDNGTEKEKETILNFIGNPEKRYGQKIILSVPEGTNDMDENKVFSQTIAAVKSALDDMQKKFPHMKVWFDQ